MTGVSGGVVTSKEKTGILLPSPFAFLHCLNAKIEYRTFDTKEIVYLKDKIKSNRSFSPFYQIDSCFGNKEGDLIRGPLRSSVVIYFHEKR